MAGFALREGWEEIVAFTETSRMSYSEIRQNMPDREAARRALNRFVENCKFENCTPQTSYIASIALK